MRKAIIGLVISLITAYVVLERQKASTQQIMSMANPAMMAAQGQGGGLPLSTQALDGQPMNPAGLPPEALASLPPEARAALEQQMNAMKAGALPGSPDGSPAPVPRQAQIDEAGPKKFSYRDRNDNQTTSFASGWTVVLERKLSDRYTTLSDQVMAQLERQLDRAATALPRPAVTELRKVQIFISWDLGAGEAIRYNWPDAKGADASRLGMLEIPRAAAFLETAQTQPWLVMHQLAHAYHDRVLKADNASVRSGYGDAMKVGSYNQVKLANGKQGRSNAATSEREFFAELTRSFYGKSDYYPFVREELQQFDGPSARIIETAWAGR
jgi:hypothetical protein